MLASEKTSGAQGRTFIVPENTFMNSI